MAKNDNINIATGSVSPIEQICKFNPLTDCMEVVGGLAVSIDDMLQTGIVKDSGETLDNNGIDDPSQIIGRINDVFDAMDAARIVKKYGKKAPVKASSEVKNVTE